MDVGAVRVGVAVSDPEGRLATPVATLRRQADGADVRRLTDLAVEYGAVEAVVGFPRSLSGAEGPAARAARAFAADLAAAVRARGLAVPIRLVDERWSTAQADRLLRGSGASGGGRRRRTVIDQAAAVVILQAALDTERAVGTPPGEVVA